MFHKRIQKNVLFKTVHLIVSKNKNFNFYLKKFNTSFYNNYFFLQNNFEKI
uniref:Uncharacterized protein n=1 Tax=Ciona intestinalis TaxID=7719 RepID=H2XZX5_CIOIN